MNEIILLKDLGMKYTKSTSNNKFRFGLYKCYCGTEFESRTQHIKSGAIKSCGCYNKQVAKERLTTHGLSKHRLYSIWASMISRCSNPKNKAYEDYGDRGIIVCNSWLNVENFINDMNNSYEKGLSIDRIDNNLGYFKENCRWTTQTVQSRNTRKLYKHNKSGYRGVCFNKKINKFDTNITLNNKIVHLGYFIDKVEAAKTYDNYIIEHNLEHTKNF